LRLKGKSAWCQWTNEPCYAPKCNYAVCFKRQLLDDGVCGLTLKRKTHEDVNPEDMFDYEIKVKGKLARKTGERSIF